MRIFHSGVWARRGGGGDGGNVTAGLSHVNLCRERWKTEEMHQAICSSWLAVLLPEHLQTNTALKVKHQLACCVYLTMW